MKLISLDDAERGRRVPGPRRPRRGPARGIRARRMDGAAPRRGGRAPADCRVRARGCAAPRAPDVGDLRAVLAAPRRGPGRSGLPRHQRAAQVRAIDHAQGSRAGTPTSSMATSRRRCASSRRSPGASSRSTAAATCSAGCSSATSSTSSTCGSTPSWWGMGPDSSRSTGQSHDLTLVESQTTPSGVTVQTYRPAGRASFRNADE